MPKLSRQMIMKGNGCGFSKSKQRSPECIVSNNNPIIIDNNSSKPNLKSSLKSKSYTRKKNPVSFSSNTKSNSKKVTPSKKKRKTYTSMKKQIQLDKANAKFFHKTKAQQLEEDIQQLLDEKLKNVSN